MKNRAKCKLCQSIIESFHSTDYVLCKCSEIAVDGGEAMLCFANNFDNFIRVDDVDNEIETIIISEETNIKTAANGMSGPQIAENISTNTKEWLMEGLKNNIDREFKLQALLKELDEMTKTIEALPKHALYEPVTQAELASVLMLLSAILRA